MWEQEPAYIRRKRERERKKLEAARDDHQRETLSALQEVLRVLNDGLKEFFRRERRKFWVDLGTGTGIWATALIATAAIFETHCSSDKQLAGMGKQQKLMQGQLDTMTAQQRPWISAKPRLEMPLMLWDTDPNQLLDFFVPIAFELQNHGPSPAINITIHSALSAPAASDQLNVQQEQLCLAAEQASKDQRAGIAVFPGDIKRGTGIASTGAVIPRAIPPMHYIMQGCIDYTYNGTMHGKTGYRIEIAHANDVSHLWESFKFHIDSREMQAGAGTIYQMNPKGVDYRETDDGGNWAR